MYSALLDCYRSGYHIVPEGYLRCDHKIDNMNYECNITQNVFGYKQFLKQKCKTSVSKIFP